MPQRTPLVPFLVELKNDEKPMQTMTVSKFKATCLAVLERVRRTGEPLLITKHGVPIAQVLPAPLPAPKEQSAFGCMAGMAEEIGDVVAPLPPEDWEALR